MLRQNLKNRALSQITGECNSAAVFAGKVFVVRPEGICRMNGYKDCGEDIHAWVKSGKFDLGTNRLKRMRFFYFGVEGLGNLKLSVFADDVLAAEYVVPVLEFNKRQEVRVPISREIAARYWAWKVENIGGAFFSLHSVQVLPLGVHTGQREG